MTGLLPLLGAVVLVAFGGLFAAIDAALSTVSIARIEELVREERPGRVVVLDHENRGSGGECVVHGISTRHRRDEFSPLRSQPVRNP